MFVVKEAKELHEFYDLEEAEDDAELQACGSYNVDLSQLEHKCDLWNNLSAIEYRIHNPELYPDDNVTENFVKLKYAEDRAFSFERKQIAVRKQKMIEYQRLIELGRRMKAEATMSVAK